MSDYCSCYIGSLLCLPWASWSTCRSILTAAGATSVTTGKCSPMWCSPIATKTCSTLQSRWSSTGRRASGVESGMSSNVDPAMTHHIARSAHPRLLPTTGLVGKCLHHRLPVSLKGNNGCRIPQLLLPWGFIGMMYVLERCERW